MALTAGYQFSKGNCVITMDADLQDPPEIIPKLVEQAAFILLIALKSCYVG